MALPPPPAAAPPRDPTGPASLLDTHDALGLAALVARGEVEPRELLEAVRRRIGERNPRINAVCALLFDRAEARIREGLPDGPFRGVPFLLKDISQHLAGAATSAGSRLFRDYRPDFDSTLVSRYRRAGLVICGKTSTPELGLCPTTEPAVFGPTRNPWNPALTAGGSSGGSGAAVAARMVPMAHGSDGSGSIRIPASCCGVFGLKPTRGRVPLGPSALEGWGGLTAHHALTISVRDSAALLDASAGPEPGSPYWAPPRARPFLEEVGADPGALRIALITRPPVDVAVDGECVRAAVETARLLEELGHRVEEAVFPFDGPAMDEARRTIVTAHVAKMLDGAGRARGRPVGEDDVEPLTWALYRQGMEKTAADYARSADLCHQTGLAMARFHERYDATLSPTLARPPLPLGELNPPRERVARFFENRLGFNPFAAVSNVTGQPSASLPLHVSPEGLPIGVMISTRFGDEATLFRLAAQLEEARPWKERKPLVAV